MGPGVKPFLVNLAGLFAKGKGNAKGKAVFRRDRLDLSYEGGDSSDECPVCPFAALDYDGAKAETRRF